MIYKAYNIVKILLATIVLIFFLWIHWFGIDSPGIAAETVYDPCSIAGLCNGGTILCAYITIGSISIPCYQCSLSE